MAVKIHRQSWSRHRIFSIKYFNEKPRKPTAKDKPETFSPQTPSPLHSPCIDAAFRVKDHPSPACRWFTTPSTSPSSVFRTGLKAKDRKNPVFQNPWHSEKSKAYFLKSKPYFFESKPDFSWKMPEIFGVKQYFYWQINFLWLNRVFKKVKAKHSFLIYCISNRYNNK